MKVAKPQKRSDALKSEKAVDVLATDPNRTAAIIRGAVIGAITMIPGGNVTVIGRLLPRLRVLVFLRLSLNLNQVLRVLIVLCLRLQA